jgi:SagB-type dehydrogenase family enzyme
VTVQTVRWAPWLYGDDEPPLDDPAEVFHEASKVHPSTAGRDPRGVVLLETNEQMRRSIGRSVRRWSQVPAVPLPEPAFPSLALGDALRARASGREFADTPLALQELASLVWAGYGVSRTGAELALRTVPSGGALYPLELYVLALRVDGLEPGVYHYDPLSHVLESLSGEVAAATIEALTAYPELVAPAGAAIFVTALFWRTRFKYGLRGYRFALLEAGHAGQNVLLAAAALDAAAVPVGGVFDRRVEELLEVDGVDESLVYAISVGRRP